MKENFVHKTMLIQGILALILSLFGYCSIDGIAQNIYFILLLIGSVVIWSILYKHFGQDFVRGAVLGLVSVCTMITVLNLYTYVIKTDDYQNNKIMDGAKSEITKNNDLVYTNGTTSLYMSKDNKFLYSITNVDGVKYVYRSSLSSDKDTEYKALYDKGYLVSGNTNEVDSFYIYPTTMSNLTGYEPLVGISVGDDTYFAPSFVLGQIDFNEKSVKDIFTLKYDASGNADGDYTISIDDGYYLIRNNLACFITPFANVSYSNDVQFQNRYIEFMKNFGDDYEFPSNLTFKLIKTIETNDENIKRVSFYYEIYDYENVGGLLMEIVHSDNTADVMYIKEMYPENFVSANVFAAREE